MHTSPGLHHYDCKGTNKDIEKMQKVLANDAVAIDHLQPSSICTSEMTLPLHDAVRLGHENCIIFLITSGAQIDILDPDNKSTLELAINLELNSIVNILLNYGASPNYLWSTRTKYLELAIEKNSIIIVKSLLKYNAIIDDYYINENGIKRLIINYESPLINALWEENTEIFRLLLLHGANLECYENDKNSIPHIIIASYVSAMETIEIMNIFKEYGGNLWSLQPDLMDRTEDCETALQSLRRQPFVYQFKGGPLDIDVKLEKLMGKPLELQSICRIKIKNILGPNFVKKSEYLPLPNQIIEYLQYKDV